MNVTKINTDISGCFELISTSFNDERGSFLKIYQKDYFDKLQLCSEWVEQYYTTSHYGVLRGMHFQSPPYDMAKLVYCIDGDVLDVIVDLRLNSDTYGHFAEINLSAAKKNMIYMPSGIAHGFLTMSKSATLVYNVSSQYISSHDLGIKWDSFGFNWPLTPSQVSQRDLAFPDLINFSSPFI